jgi:hypothetical protein
MSPNPTPETRARAVVMNQLYNEQGWTYERIGRWFGITRERVRQILVACGYRTGPRPRPDPLCGVCGQHYPRNGYTAHYLAAGHKRQIGRVEVNPERNDAIVADYLRGEMSGEEIGRKYEMKQEGIYPILHRRGIVPDRGGGRYERTPDSKARLQATIRAKPRHALTHAVGELRLRGVAPRLIQAAFGLTQHQTHGAIFDYKKRRPGLKYPPIDAAATVGPNESAGSGDPAPPDAGSIAS